MKTITLPYCEICETLIDKPDTGFVFGSGVKDAVAHGANGWLLGGKTKLAVHRDCFASHFELNGNTRKSKVAG